MVQNKLTDIEFVILTALLKAEKELRYSELKQICDLTDPTLYKYLKKLTADEYLLRRENRTKREYPHPVFYKISNDIKTFKFLVNEFVGTPEGLTFHSSAYSQSMINQKLAEIIKDNWSYRKDSDLKDVDLKDMPPEEYLKWYLGDLDLQWILKTSPTALKKALAPQEGKKYFVEIMLTNLISDIRTNNLPVNLSVDMGVSARDQRHRINKRVGESIYRMPLEPSYKVEVDLR